MCVHVCVLVTCAHFLITPNSLHQEMPEMQGPSPCNASDNCMARPQAADCAAQALQQEALCVPTEAVNASVIPHQRAGPECVCRIDVAVCFGTFVANNNNNRSRSSSNSIIGACIIATIRALRPCGCCQPHGRGSRRALHGPGEALRGQAMARVR